MSHFDCKECDRKFHSADALNSHNLAKHPIENTPKNFGIKKKHFYWLIFVFIVFALGFWIYSSTTSPGKYDSFAECLTSEGFIMAGTDWCSSCQEQKKFFGKSFKYINYKNCDIEKEWCDEQKITRYPTWIISDKTQIRGKLEISELVRLSNCSTEKSSLCSVNNKTNGCAD